MALQSPESYGIRPTNAIPVYVSCKIESYIFKTGDGQDKPMCFRPNPVNRCIYDNCMYHMMNKIKV